jgi:[acyl-carrier-protein] S-malonyltransferase
MRQWRADTRARGEPLGTGVVVTMQPPHTDSVRGTLSAEDPIYLFPGQGSQVPGMRERVRSICPEILELVEDLLGADPFARDARSTRLLQPAILCASVAGWLRLQQLEGDAMDRGAFAGHSLGEVSALVAGGAIDAEDGVRLVVRRGELMADAAAEGTPGGMMALLGVAPDAAADFASRFGLVIATDNAPGETVLAGPDSALESAGAAAIASGLKIARLAIAGAFHSPAMATIQAPFAQAVRATSPRPPVAPVYSGVTTEPFDDDVAGLLARALTEPVRWRETLLHLHAAGARRFVEVGPGTVLSGLVRRTLPDVEITALDDEPERAWPQLAASAPRAVAS